jgi:hypothetical protein
MEQCNFYLEPHLRNVPSPGVIVNSDFILQELMKQFPILTLVAGSDLLSKGQQPCHDELNCYSSRESGELKVKIQTYLHFPSTQSIHLPELGSHIYPSHV